MIMLLALLTAAVNAIAQDLSNGAANWLTRVRQG